MTRSTRALRGTATVLLWLAWLAGLAAVIAGIVLITHTTQHCGFNRAGDTYCDPDKHPLAPLGIGVIIGGLVQAGLLAAVSRIAHVVGELRDAADHTT